MNLVQNSYSFILSSFCELILVNDSWNMVMVMVLLCQGLIFETDEETGPAFLLFGVVMVIVLCSAVIGSVFMVLKRALTASGSVFISKSAMLMFNEGTQAELHQLYSSELFKSLGLLEIERKKSGEWLTEEQLRHLSDFDHKIYFSSSSKQIQHSSQF
jgi:hypothetical protein